jgi:hypothetical protein
MFDIVNHILQYFAMRAETCSVFYRSNPGIVRFSV